jgi:type I restriction enzyme, S subunit
MGAIGLSNYDGVTSPAYDILRAKRPISGEYYHTLFRSPICSSELKRHSRGIMDMRLRLYFDKFGDILVPYPPIIEQIQITKKLNQIDSEIGKAKGLLQNQIEKLQELKSTLINSAVTGKIRV